MKRDARFDEILFGGEYYDCADPPLCGINYAVSSK